jgi:hypothetical protein
MRLPRRDRGLSWSSKLQGGSVDYTYLRVTKLPARELPSGLFSANRTVLVMKQHPSISCVSLLQSLHLNLLVQAPSKQRTHHSCLKTTPLVTSVEALLRNVG